MADMVVMAAERGVSLRRDGSEGSYEDYNERPPGQGSFPVTVEPVRAVEIQLDWTRR